jgi:hypothetical protein
MTTEDVLLHGIIIIIIICKKLKYRLLSMMHGVRFNVDCLKMD